MATQHDKVDRIVAVLLAQVPESIRYDVALRFQEASRLCKVSGCEQPQHAHGYCKAHYNKHFTTQQHCMVSRCEGKHVARGYCDKHYRRFRKYGSPYIVKGERVECNRLPNPDTLPVTTCQVDGCNGPMQAGGKCMKHYQQERRQRHAA